MNRNSDILILLLLLALLAELRQTEAGAYAQTWPDPNVSPAFSQTSAPTSFYGRPGRLRMPDRRFSSHDRSDGQGRSSRTNGCQSAKTAGTRRPHQHLCPAGSQQHGRNARPAAREIRERKHRELRRAGGIPQRKDKRPKREIFLRNGTLPQSGYFLAFLRRNCNSGFFFRLLCAIMYLHSDCRGKAEGRADVMIPSIIFSALPQSRNH